MARRIPQQAIAIWKRREESNRVKLVAYWDGYRNWTVGWGHTGPEVVKGYTVTPARAEADMMADLTIAIRGIEALVHVPLNDNEISALISFTGNAGTGRFATSTLLRKLNAGDRVGAAQEFMKWVYAADESGKLQYSSGLKDRRAEEMALFLTPVPGSVLAPPDPRPRPDPDLVPEPLPPDAPTPPPGVEPIEYLPSPSIYPEATDIGTAPAPLSQSTTIWGTVAAAASGGGGMLLAYINSPYALIAVGMILFFAYFVIKARFNARKVGGI